jgi:hypothetical protein
MPNHAAGLQLLLEPSRGYNFLTRLVDGIFTKISDADASALLDYLSSMPMDEATERLLRCGEEVYEYVGFMAAASQAITRLPIDGRIAAVRGGSVLERVSKAPVTATRCSEAGVNRYFSGGCGEYGAAVAGDRVRRRLTETDARTRRSEWCQALYCEG